MDTRKGEALWKKDLESEYDVQEYCTSASPLIEGHLLIVSIGSYVGGSGSCVLALDKDSGKEMWKSANDGLTYSSPIVIAAGGKRQMIVWTQKAVISLDPASGKTYWREPISMRAGYPVSTPVRCGNRLLIGGLMMTLDPDKPAGSVLWPEPNAISRSVLSSTSTAYLQGDCLFSARSSGELVCLEASTGKEIWSNDSVTNRKAGASIHLTPHGDAVFLYTDQGDLILAKLTAKGYQEISRTRLIEPTYPHTGRKVAWPPPAYADRHVFVRNDKELICASLAKPQTPIESPNGSVESPSRTSASAGDDR